MATDTFEHRLIVEPAGVDEAQALLAHWLRSRALGAPQRRDALIIASELCAAAQGPAGNEITLRAALHRDCLVLDVEGNGHGFAWNGHDVSEREPGGMKGFRRVGSIAEAVSVHVAAGGTMVRSTTRLL